ncbi:MAG: hypothetical protein LBP59_14625 [Planctomycetaceae bacterium]|nr:hypothetical protein [Planctomycetaceae bacterium]
MRVCLLAFLVIFAGGCGNSARPADLPKLTIIFVTINQDGAGLGDASIVLFAEPPIKWSVGGVTNTTGICKPRTHGQFDGVPLGKYKVVVTKDITEIPEVSPDTPKDDDGQPILDGIVYSLVEEKYVKIETTPLTIEVDGKNNQFILDVGKAVKNRKEK